VPRSGHVAALRRHVGTRRLLLPSVSVLIGDDAGALLLLRHLDGGRWGTPGGAVEPDEQPADAAVREAWEETGLHVVPTAVVGVFGGPDHEITYDNGDVTAYVSTAFAARVVGGRLRPGDGEISEARWVTNDERHALTMLPFMREIVDAGFAHLTDPGAPAGFAPARWRPPAR
jgi:8-oxo-dGTP pyrophosphatase MutT (NUDIX family)